ncbi:MAG: CoA pyrophosphatase [Chloroflexi bacterium]|nr:CoA pyrophosphatase [Chloroflexota bacterium]
MKTTSSIKQALSACAGLPLDLTERLAKQLASMPSPIIDERLQLNEALHPAAVLIPLLCHDGEWHLLLTRRTEKLWSHPGQVAFPGGAWEEGDTNIIQTALRESFEEVSLLPESVTVLGTMPSFSTISHFELTPVVGIISWPQELFLRPEEVARAFIVPLSFLKDPVNHYFQDYIHESESHPVLYFKRYDGELIWGITAQVILAFLKILED